MTPADLHADLETVLDAESRRDGDLLRAVCRKSTLAPICDQCAVAEGAITAKAHVTYMRADYCAVCGHGRVCTAIRDWVWTRLVYRRRLFPLETK
jgi:hypothetical protein